MPTSTPTIASQATALATVLSYAAEVGIPAPIRAEITDYDTGVDLTVTSVADLTEWTRALESTVREKAGTDYRGVPYLHLHTRGALLELGVVVNAWLFGEEAAR